MTSYGVKHMSQQICYHLLESLPQQQKQRLVKTLQELNQPSKRLISSTESITADNTTSTSMQTLVSSTSQDTNSTTTYKSNALICTIDLQQDKC